jgi:hypothetical protein
MCSSSVLSRHSRPPASCLCTAIMSSSQTLHSRMWLPADALSPVAPQAQSIQRATFDSVSSTPGNSAIRSMTDPSRRGRHPRRSQSRPVYRAAHPPGRRHRAFGSRARRASGQDSPCQQTRRARTRRTAQSIGPATTASCQQQAPRWPPAPLSEWTRSRRTIWQCCSSVEKQDCQAGPAPRLSSSESRRVETLV